MELGECVRRPIQGRDETLERAACMEVGVVSRPVGEEVSAPWTFHEIRVEADTIRDPGQEAESGCGAREKLQINQGFEPQPADLEQPPQRAPHHIFEAARVNGQDVFQRDQVMGVEDETVFVKDEEIDILPAELLDRVADGGAGENRRALLGQLDKEEALSGGGDGFWKQSA